MKIAILTDTHIGVKNGDESLLKYQEDFFLNQFFPYCKANQIKTIFHLGDFFDNRKHLNVNVLERAKHMFLYPLLDHGMDMRIIAGNHDVYYKNTNRVNSLLQFFNVVEVNVIDNHACDIPIGGKTFGFVPWINEDNHDQITEFLKGSMADMILGHFEFSGFKMMKGAETVSHGESPEMVKRFKKVLSGHYHTRSEMGNVRYLGTPYEMSWADSEDPKGFYVLDTETMELEEVRNHSQMFRTLHYNGGISVQGLTEDSRIRLIVTNDKGLDDFVRECEEVIGVKDLKIIENTLTESDESEIDDVVNSTSDTITMIERCCDEINFEDKERLKLRFQELYTKAYSI